MKLGLYRIHHKDARIGAIVIAKNVTVMPRPGKGQRYCVEVDGVKFIDFCGASFICDIDEVQSEQILDKIAKDVKSFESIR